MKQNVVNRFTHKSKGKQNNKLSVVLLSASMGYRTKSYGAKSLIPLSKNICLLEHQIAAINHKYSNNEIVVVIGYETDKIMKRKIKGCRFVENLNYEETGEYEQLRLGLNNVDNDNVLIINGSLYFNHGSINSTIPSHSYVTTTNNINSKLEVGSITNDHELQCLSYGLDKDFWTEVAFFTGRELALLRSVVSDRAYNRFLYFEAINTIIDNKGVFQVYDNNDTSLFKIETIADIKQVKIENSNS